MPTSLPTVVLVHGAFAESSSWNEVIERLQAAGVPVIAAANPLRSLDGDASSVRSLISSIDGPVVAVGHSYGGAVISNAATGLENVGALVFVAAFAPEVGETIGDLSGKFPGSTLGETLHAVELSDGTTDFFIQPERYRAQFAADVAEERARLDAATQRPLNTEALNGRASEPAWRSIPSFFVFSSGDRNIPVEALRFMAERAAAVEAIEIPDASHALPVSQPAVVADLILRAVESVRATTD
ncbi:alpha/beta fold hydrolase [Labedella endophytica]|uniref:Alpha/beta hydrolase n=1 Tax=Labedella endophytica TaxID=1523160 RepID=A0A3S0VE10_9MICO|nr:alpha/beta hydrolase [Labedella endophytica]RUQ98136.1 alpha/beta hydrolase [Labedella endophytica]